MTSSMGADLPTPQTHASVLHLIESDGLYGAGRVVLALAREAATDARFPSTIGCLVDDPSRPHPLADRAREEHLPAIRLKLGRSSALLDLVRILSTLKRIRPRIIHTHGYKAAIVGYAAHLVTGATVVATCHGWVDDSQGRRSYAWLTRLERRLYPWFSRVVSVSPLIARQLEEWGVSSARITQIPNGITIPPPPSAETVAQLRRRHNISSDAIVVLSVGRLSEEKGQADLVDAAAQLMEKYPALRVLILGEGHLNAALQARINERKVEGVVSLLGFQSNVSDYLALADVFALPSLSEGLPLSILEALAAGIPIVSTPVGAIPTLLEDGVSALFVPIRSPGALAAAIEALITRPDLRAALARSGRNIVAETGTARTMYERYREVYGELVKQ